MGESTEEEISVGNRVISKYLFDINNQYFDESNLVQFDKSFDDLMPVLSFINRDSIVEISYSLVVSVRIFIINGKATNKAYAINHDNNGLEPIVPIWRAVVEYINYYNSKVEERKLLINIIE